MAEEASGYHGDPCGIYGDIYKYFLDQPTQALNPPTSASTTSSYSDEPAQSMLVTGFGMRNWDSLHRALIDDEQRRQMLLVQHDKEEVIECESKSSAESIKLTISETMSKGTFLTSPSDTPTPRRLSLKYLMGLAVEQEAYDEMPTTREKRLPSILGEAEDDDQKNMTAAMRKARKYLREHKIFEFFQFLIASMLGQQPENPIEFLIDLLDQSLLYRSGFGSPPLLFEKPHLEQLFYLMDPMRTGFIDTNQYKTGMKTLGICSYDKNPPLTTDGMVSKDFFIDEAYECLTDLFVDMIRHRDRATTPSLLTPPPTAAPSFLSGGQ